MVSSRNWFSRRLAQDPRANKNAVIENVGPLLIPDGAFVRLYDHIPQMEYSWWRASVPLSKGGPNRRLSIRGLSFDVEFVKSVFLESGIANFCNISV